MMGMKMEVFQIDRERAYFPTKGWKLSTPEEQGMDSSFLADAIRYIEKHFKSYFSFILIKNGYLIFEAHNERPYEEKSSQLLKACCSLLTKVLGKPGDTSMINILICLICGRLLKASYRFLQGLP